MVLGVEDVVLLLLEAEGAAGPALRRLTGPLNLLTGEGVLPLAPPPAPPWGVDPSSGTWYARLLNSLRMGGSELAATDATILRLDFGPEARTHRILVRSEGAREDDPAVLADGPGVTAGEELRPLSSGDAVPLTSLPMTDDERLDKERGSGGCAGKPIVAPPLGEEVRLALPLAARPFIIELDGVDAFVRRPRLSNSFCSIMTARLLCLRSRSSSRCALRRAAAASCCEGMVEADAARARDRRYEMEST